jgi:uncharacterized protein (DUF1015 family)
MADVRPLNGLRYQTSMAGNLGDVLAPPYDVISDETQQALYDRSPFNVVRLEYGVEGEQLEANRYQAAAATLDSWRRTGVLAADQREAFYLYEQQFEHAGREFRRRAILGAVRLEPWERRIVLPHEHTMAGPKQDRLRLLRACRTNVSPVLVLYRPDDGKAIEICESALGAHPDVDARDLIGQRHLLWVIDEPDAVRKLADHFSDRALYVADGHHRYETALAYRDERRASSSQWTGDEPENFVLMALTAADDPGLLILPIHRLVRPVSEPSDLLSALDSSFSRKEVGASGADSQTAMLVESMITAADRVTLGALGLPGGPATLSLSNRASVEEHMPAGHSDAWRKLAVNVLQYGILDPVLAIDIEVVRGGGHVDFTESADQAAQSVQDGSAKYAFLVPATRPEEIFAVADAGDRMPQKSTYFYPKLGTGLVLRQMDTPPAVRGA